MARLRCSLDTSVDMWLCRLDGGAALQRSDEASNRAHDAGGKVDTLRGSKRRHFFRKNALVVATTALGITGLLVTGASAQITSPPTVAGTIYSCVNKTTGAI